MTDTKPTTERPMLMTAPMVRAILNGRKTMTRRVVKPQPPESVLEMSTYHHPKDDTHFCVWGWDGKEIVEDSDRVCPYGQPGDRLWVRETFYADPEDGCTLYRADGDFDGDQYDAGYRWQPSIHMPRRASRITLEITAVRVERLNDISEEDAAAEGAPSLCHFNAYDSKHMHGFIHLWESINGPGSWALNPWVWVIEFRRVTT